MKDAKDRNVLRWAMPLGGGGEMELIVHTALPIDPEEAAILSRILELVMEFIQKETACEPGPEA